MKDKNGIEIERGQVVNVPEPNETDNHYFEFTGTVVNINGWFVVVSDSDLNYFEIEPERLEVVDSLLIKTSRDEVVSAMTNWIREADSESLIMIFNEYFNGKLIYNSEDESYSLDSDEAVRLGITPN